MRDIGRYPVTNGEIVDCLHGFLAEVDPKKTGLIGDMRPLLLAEAIAIITQYDALTKPSGPITYSVAKGADVWPFGGKR